MIINCDPELEPVLVLGTPCPLLTLSASPTLPSSLFLLWIGLDWIGLVWFGLLFVFYYFLGLDCSLSTINSPNPNPHE